MKQLFKSYKDRLLDHKWIEKRNRVLKRDNYSCQYCGERDKQLHVHHFCYNENYNPWDVDDTALITLCKTCHTNGHIKTLSDLEKGLFDLIRMSGMIGNSYNYSLVSEANKLILKNNNNG